MPPSSLTRPRFLADHGQVGATARETFEKCRAESLFVIFKIRVEEAPPNREAKSQFLRPRRWSESLDARLTLSGSAAGSSAIEDGWPSATRPNPQISLRGQRQPDFNAVQLAEFLKQAGGAGQLGPYDS